ncbi:MAG: hypothetical protein OHK93_008462 [Ramalina farinacea]|uniref:chitinase n=1 Tax=Ramalina farinacea TaxID=258253 RepID=A0AA43QPJ4_9LECA|nr:hypothetical protein [Ramalina farinacea]
MPCTLSILLIHTLLSLLLPLTLAQTWTSCNPLNGTCPADTALSTNHTFDFTLAQPGNTWNLTAGAISYSPTTGAAFTINQKGDSPTIQSKFYLFFGVVEVWMQAATGKGIVSSIVLQSDDLDEIDWEIIGSNTTHVENNYYGKGNTTDAVARAKWYPMPGANSTDNNNSSASSSSPQDGFHNYTTSWTQEKLEWYVDGSLIRTLKYEDANGGASYPQTPCQLRLGIWPAGDPSNNNYTVAWAGGEVDYKKGPYTMNVKSARVTDFSSGKEYQYGDRTGSWQSIKTIPGNSTSQETLSKPPEKSLKQQFEGLSKGGKIGVAVGVIGAAVLALAGLWACCAIQRRKGRKEAALADAAYERDTAELLEYRAQGPKGWEKI